MPYVKAKIISHNKRNKEEEIDFWTTSTTMSGIEKDAVASLERIDYDMLTVKDIEFTVSWRLRGLDSYVNVLSDTKKELKIKKVT